MKDESQTFEELIVGLIAKDEKFSELFRTKVAEGLKNFDFGDIIADQLTETIARVFEDDAIFELVEDSVKVEVSKAITKYFTRGKAK